jgi:hypothetical protein
MKGVGQYARPIANQRADGEALPASTMERRNLAECRAQGNGLYSDVVKVRIRPIFPWMLVDCGIHSSITGGNRKDQEDRHEYSIRHKPAGYRRFDA